MDPPRLVVDKTFVFQESKFPLYMDQIYLVCHPPVSYLRLSHTSLVSFRLPLCPITHPVTKRSHPTRGTFIYHLLHLIS